MTLVESFSGIRGKYPKEINEEIAVRYGYAFSKLLRKKNKDIQIVIGRDTRHSGEIIRRGLIEGLDCNIIDVGILPTAAIQNAVREYKAAGGIIITASHNEPEFNGFKFLDKDGAVLRPNDIKEVIENYHNLNELDEEEFLNILYKKNEIDNVKQVKIKHEDAKKRYKKFIFSFFKQKFNYSKHIIIDSNGGTGDLTKEIFDELNIKAKYLNLKQGEFKRKIEPNEDSLKNIKFKNEVFAAGFDCDADRVEILTKDQKLISGNHILALITDYILSNTKNPQNSTVVVNDATSYVVKDVVENYNSKWKEVEVGEINVVDTMIDFNSLVGGEGSNGGIIIPKSRCRDGILTILYLIQIMSEKKKDLIELVDELEEYFYIKDKVKLKKNFDKIRDKVFKYYLDLGYTIEQTGDETGGLKAIFNGSWVWFRQSKTEDKVLRIIVDSKDEKIAKKMLKEGRNIIT